LIFYRFSDSEIDQILTNSGIGKWKSAKPAYREHTRITAHRNQTKLMGDDSHTSNDDTKGNTTKDDPNKPCSECRFFRSGINDRLEEWARCEHLDDWLKPFHLRTCGDWEPKKARKAKNKSGDNGNKTALELLANKHDIPAVVSLIKEIEKVEKVRPHISGKEYTYKFHINDHVLIIPSGKMLSWRFFS